MTNLNVSTSVEQYEDQTNVTVDFELGGQEWSVQTDMNGNYSQQNGCLIWVDGVCDVDHSENENFKAAIEVAEKAAKEKHVELKAQ